MYEYSGSTLNLMLGKNQVLSHSSSPNCLCGLKHINSSFKTLVFYEIKICQRGVLILTSQGCWKDRHKCKKH